MNEKLVKIMEMIIDEGVRASLDLDLLGRLCIYLWDDMARISGQFVIRNAHDITDSEVTAVSAMIEAYKKSQPARKA